MTESLEHGYSSERTPQELSNEYQHDRVKMVLKNLCILVLWTKVASALEGLKVGPEAIFLGMLFEVRSGKGQMNEMRGTSDKEIIVVIDRASDKRYSGC